MNATVEFAKEVKDRKFIIQMACVVSPIEEGDSLLDGFPVRLDIFDVSNNEEWIPVFKNLKPSDKAPELPGEECPELAWLENGPCKNWVADMLFVRVGRETYRRCLNEYEERLVDAFLHQ